MRSRHWCDREDSGSLMAGQSADRRSSTEDGVHVTLTAVISRFAFLSILSMAHPSIPADAVRAIPMWNTAGLPGGNGWPAPSSNVPSVARSKGVHVQPSYLVSPVYVMQPFGRYVTSTSARCGGESFAVYGRTFTPVTTHDRGSLPLHSVRLTTNWPFG